MRCSLNDGVERPQGHEVTAVIGRLQDECHCSKYEFATKTDDTWWVNREKPLLTTSSKLSESPQSDPRGLYVQMEEVHTSPPRGDGQSFAFRMNVELLSRDIQFGNLHRSSPFSKGVQPRGSRQSRLVSILPVNDRH